MSCPALAFGFNEGFRSSFTAPKKQLLTKPCVKLIKRINTVDAGTELVVSQFKDGFFHAILPDGHKTSFHYRSCNVVESIEKKDPYEIQKQGTMKKAGGRI